MPGPPLPFDIDLLRTFGSRLDRQILRAEREAAGEGGAGGAEREQVIG